MKQRSVSAVIYAITTLSIACFFDGLYGAGPVKHHLELIHVALVGASLFACACVLSIFAVRFGVACGLVACILSWPYFGFLLFATRWSGLTLLVLRLPQWQDLFAALLLLFIASAYTAYGVFQTR
jgi:hypothetical protein